MANGRPDLNIQPVRSGNRVSFGSRIELDVGCSRAVRTGDTIYVSGMTATGLEGEVLATSLYDQAMVIFQKVELALRALGGSMDDVVKETVYFANWEDEDQWYRAHSETFGEVRPVVTGIAVSLYRPEVLLEIDAIAVIGNRTAYENSDTVP
jgi:enamine deaminase RidA (YjgF/YER057c/UK114 family)